MATEVLVSIKVEYGAQCFTAEAHASRAYLEATNAISFTDEDMEVKYLDHKRPLYLTASINKVQVQRALVDTGSSLNLILMNKLQAANTSRRKIQGTPMEVTGFGGAAEYTIGHIQLALKVSPILSLTRFHVIDSAVSYHVLLSRPWLHKHKLVSSTYHQCVKGRLNGKPIRLPANNAPFDETEAHFVEAAFYEDLAPVGEASTFRTIGTPLSSWEDIRDHPEVDFRNILELKRKRKEAVSEAQDQRPKCITVQLPNRKMVYRL